VAIITKEQQKKANTLLTTWLAKSQRPFSLVEDQGFRDYVEYITQDLAGMKVDIQSRTGIAVEVGHQATQLRASLKAKIKANCDRYCLTTDLWSDRSMRGFMAVTLHYLDAEFEMNDWTLEVIRFEGKHTGSAIASALAKSLQKWGLDKSKCVRLVRDGAANAVSAGNQFEVPHASCLAHSLHLVVAGAMIKKKSRRPTLVANSHAQGEMDAATETAVDFMNGNWPGDFGGETINTRVDLCEFEEDHSFTATETSSGPPDGDSRTMLTALETTSEADAECIDAVVEMMQENACEAVDAHVEEGLRQDDQRAMNAMRATVQVFRALSVHLRKSSKAKDRFIELRKKTPRGMQPLAYFGLSDALEQLCGYAQAICQARTYHYPLLCVPRVERGQGGIWTLPPSAANSTTVVRDSMPSGLAWPVFGGNQGSERQLVLNFEHCAT
jgi:hypothetical protein